MNYFKTRIKILFLNAYFTFQKDTAYVFNNWGNFISGTFYMFSALLFTNIIYAGTNTLAGLTKDQMLFYMALSQICFYAFASISWHNIRDLVVYVNTGQLDLVLTKPLPSLFYLSFKTIDIYSVFRDYFFGLAILILNINFDNLNINLTNFLVGIIILILGSLISASFHFILALTVFWLGESSNITELGFFLEYDIVHPIPFAGWDFSKHLQIILVTCVPLLISTGISSSVIFGYLEMGSSLIFVAIIFIVFNLAKYLTWEFAIRNYSSASS